MNRSEFCSELRAGLCGLPTEDIERSLDYYCEMIDDHIESGLTEEEAVAAVGPVWEIISGILADTPLTKIVKEKVRAGRTLRAWEVILLILGSPIWVPLLLATVILALTAYALIWVFVVVLYAVVLSFAAAAVSCIAGAFPIVLTGNFVMCAMYFGVGLFSAGLTILSFIGTGHITRGIINLCKNVFYGVKACFVGKGGIA